ncbi:hypothetical protein [Paenibacillus sp. SI8]|uniref:hypothetical protein n=1 Tax=unclassified Paenibacillus TaxID=185978 RepID=UPI003467940B
MRNTFKIFLSSALLFTLVAGSASAAVVSTPPKNLLQTASTNEIQEISMKVGEEKYVYFYYTYLSSGYGVVSVQQAYYEPMRVPKYRITALKPGDAVVKYYNASISGTVTLNIHVTE